MQQAILTDFCKWFNRNNDTEYMVGMCIVKFTRRGGKPESATIFTPEQVKGAVAKFLLEQSSGVRLNPE